ncbi:PDZ domain-containing protein 8 [Chelonus insularis]|uniref:PDZ domain-containing protein 8 n=1 Tax=Chelonus insularis TaxID=460826 RepID=UPI0015899B0D|nr:PDZ domain-containing protein 8 [Chelonus insularis]XP_034948221.1 PDZ domain-containing protein 8 [Chelonus insularis]
MDFFLMLILAVIIFTCGIICTLAVEFYILKKYLEGAPKAKPPGKIPSYGKAVLPDELLKSLNDEKNKFTSNLSRSHQNFSQGNENLAINLTLQFLFNELKHAERVRLWLYRKLNNEFKELLTQTTTGRLFDSVQLRELNLGTQFPTIKGLEVADSVIDRDTGLLETLDLSLDLHYSGNFQLSIDVKMLLGKTAYLSLQVKRITGKARLQFTRIPYTHWSLSFYSEPILELEVQSQFQGRQLQPQIVSLITGQIRRAIRRKHTLPRYKMRYKPFFRRLNDEDIDLSEVVSTQLTPGLLEVVLVEVERLNLGQSNLPLEDSSLVEIYCTISVDSTPWVYLTQYGGVPYMVLDLIISKPSSHQLGVVFKQEVVPEIGQNCVLVETIVTGSPAAIAEMRKGDILVSVDGKKISNMNQVGKIVKNAAQRRFIIRVERKYSNKADFDRCSNIIKSNEFDDHVKIKHEPMIKFSDLKEHSDSELLDKADSGIKLFRRRKSSIQVSYDDFQSSEPLSRRISTISNVSTASSSGTTAFSDDYLSPSLTDLYITTKEKPFASSISFEETRTFQIDSELQYLNIGVWARYRGGDVPPKILGYINAPIKLILAQCSTSTTGHYLKCHPLLPPDTASFASLNSKLQGYSGFDPSLCYGDILLSYRWISTNINRRIISSDFSKREIETVKSIPVVNNDVVDKKSHDFIRTHFHRATHCDFCSKKIWLKDAVQCRDCGMVCHKKCEARCQTSGACGAENLTNMAFEVDEMESNVIVGEVNPEISLTSCEEQVQGMMAVKASIANTLLGLKKAGSTSCLAPPSSTGGLTSRSLPPSPCSSRKNSLVGGLGISPDLLEGAEPSVATPLIAGELNDGLMSHAKDTGRFLFNNLEPEERVDKINLMMGKLKAALDFETTSRLDLSQSNDEESAKLIAQSDLRVQALSVLLLHYCAGLQHAQEILDRTKKQNSNVNE